MLTKRIIPCLDIKDGRTVKGVNFVSLRDAGDPVELAAKYAATGADELVFLDISATEQGRKTMADLVLKVAATVDIPFTVGGGISSVADVDILLKNGADKVSINSSAVRRPELIKELSQAFGAQCVVVAIDAKKIGGQWLVHLVGGKQATKLDLFDWAKQIEQLGAGEILFTSMDHDGTKGGFANEALAKMAECVNIPIIASGGAGNMEDFYNAFTFGKADAALAASIFHYGEVEIPELKAFLKDKKIPIRSLKNVMKVDFSKNTDGLVPAIIQDATTKNVLMLGYMNESALVQTQQSNKVTFYSRTKKRLWTKGEESGNFLNVVDIVLDCDSDTLLIQVNPQGPTCHTGSDTCWNKENKPSYGFLSTLENTIVTRVANGNSEDSYVASLFDKGIHKIAQKVGEEAVEVVIEAMDNNKQLFLEESADLLFHYLMLLHAKETSLDEVVQLLASRQK